MCIKRNSDESFSDYQARRKIDNRARKNRLKGIIIHESVTYKKNKKAKKDDRFTNTILGKIESVLSKFTQKDHDNLYARCMY